MKFFSAEMLFLWLFFALLIFLIIGVTWIAIDFILKRKEKIKREQKKKKEIWNCIQQIRGRISSDRFKQQSRVAVATFDSFIWEGNGSRLAEQKKLIQELEKQANVIKELRQRIDQRIIELRVQDELPCGTEIAEWRFMVAQECEKMNALLETRPNKDKDV